MRLRIDLSYDGAPFSGWAKQPGRPSVQGALEAALARVFRVDPDHLRIVVAGRTDAGVHATGQVCHVDLPAELSGSFQTESGVKTVTKRLRGVLRSEPAIWISSVSIAPEGFDARFSPTGRRYEYRIADADSAKDPRRAAHTLWLEQVLALEPMNEMGVALVGLHDWASFCRQRAGATTIRTLQEFSWKRDGEGVLIATVRADAFCHSMVRSLVGAAVAVGRGKLSVADVVTLRDQASRTSAWKTMPAHGLTLVEVSYPPDTELQIQASKTRNPRGPLSD